MADDLPARLRRAQGRKFGLTVGAAFGVFAALAAWRGPALLAGALAAASAVLIVGAAVAPAALLPVERAWMTGARVISRVTTPVIMGVLYFGLITPVGLARRALGRGTLTRGRGRGASGWVVREPGARRSDLTRQF